MTDNGKIGIMPFRHIFVQFNIDLVFLIVLIFHACNTKMPPFQGALVYAFNVNRFLALLFPF